MLRCRSHRQTGSWSSRLQFYRNSLVLRIPLECCSLTYVSSHGPSLCEQWASTTSHCKSSSASVKSTFYPYGTVYLTHSWTTLNKIFFWKSKTFAYVSYLIHQFVIQPCVCSCTWWAHRDRGCFSTARICTTVILSSVYYRLVLHAAAVSICRGHNQRMEFLGDSIMQLVATEYLFIHFPDHHEGHLTVSISLVRSSFHPKIALFYFSFFLFYSLWCIVSTAVIFNSYFYLCVMVYSDHNEWWL